MDFVNNLTGGNKNNAENQSENTQQSGGFMDKLNGMAGGGAQGEKNEDALDKSMPSLPLFLHTN